MFFSGITSAMASAPRIESTITSPVAMKIAFGNCLAGLRISVTWTPDISMPERATIMFVSRTSCPKLSSAGTSFPGEKRITGALPAEKYQIASRMMRIPGITVPNSAPELLRNADSLMP